MAFAGLDCELASPLLCRRTCCSGVGGKVSQRVYNTQLHSDRALESAALDSVGFRLFCLLQFDYKVNDMYRYEGAP